MRAHSIIFASLLFLLNSLAPAQNYDRKFKNFTAEGTQLKIQVSDGYYLFRPLNPNILQTSFIPEGESYDPRSHAVVLQPAPMDMVLKEDDQTLEWSSEGMAVTITKFPFTVSYSYRGRFLIAEKSGYIRSDTTEQLEFKLDPSEVLYGGGARVLGMDRRGNLLKLYNKAHYGYETHSQQMNFTLPLVLSSKRYAIHFDNAPIGYLDLDSKGDNTLKYETINGRKTYQVIGGESWSDIVDHYTRLTGRQPMPPRWVFGNFSSRFGYHTQKETLETVDLFLKDSIPLDAVVIDIYWFGADIKGHMGNLEFLQDSFPTPEKMMADFKMKGVKTILVTEPFILTTSKRWDEAVEKKLLGTDSLGNPYTYDFYFGHTGLIDIYDTSAAAWFWNIYREYTTMGVGGWWGDLGEPEVHPSGLQHAAGSADEVHNIYGHDWAGMIFKGYKKDFPDQRPFILMRAGYSGSQRYGMIPWSGDVLRSWGGLIPQPEIALQMGMQGLGYMHSDLGGFAEGVTFDPELYTRWLQYGVFQPVFRPHAQEHIPAEPVYHDDRTKALAKKSIELRYRLLPYNYTLAFENNRTGMPLMRPVLFEEPDNPKAQVMSNCYLWGNAFLVSPVTAAGLAKQKVYFPLGSNWFDFYSGEKYTGGQSYRIRLADDHIPVFVRGGSFIPMTDPVQSTDYYSTDTLSVHYYYDPGVPYSEYTLYDDDGITPEAFEKGQFELLKFTGRPAPKSLEISMASLPGEAYQPPDRVIALTIHQFHEQLKRILINGQEEPYLLKAGGLRPELIIGLQGGTEATITLEWEQEAGKMK